MAFTQRNLTQQYRKNFHDTDSPITTIPEKTAEMNVPPQEKSENMKNKELEVNRKWVKLAGKTQKRIKKTKKRLMGSLHLKKPIDLKNSSLSCLAQIKKENRCTLPLTQETSNDQL